ncbi:unnamed protein product [Cyberlindnera jadinii]|uniref:Uncharacterized protein n=1 Tax=Cyberlindnera jadinii (strain ATCC 18201 / CBS 1600 / BCRC 20928 / JCM 3617 / NBRC 0987 / NRRL Y-1542) TaxID=983966 RepID=A0A0H5C9D3_CYBJN|nr:unnamed protein product [Cyberlindnera jadinii]
MAEQIAKNARDAFTVLKTLSNEERNEALKAVHDALAQAKQEILKPTRRIWLTLQRPICLPAW